MQTPRISVVMVTWNRLGYTRASLPALHDAAAGYPDLEVIAVDNGSTDGTAEFLREASRAGLIDKLILLDRNLGNAAGYNWGLAHADRDAAVLVKLDCDVKLVTPGWPRRFIAIFEEHREIGILGWDIVNFAPVHDIPTERVGRFDLMKADFVMGAAFAFRRRVFDELGWFNEPAKGVFSTESLSYYYRAARAGIGRYYVRGLAAHHQSELDDTLYREYQSVKFTPAYLGEESIRTQVEKAIREGSDPSGSTRISYPKYEGLAFPPGSRVLEVRHRDDPAGGEPGFVCAYAPPPGRPGRDEPRTRNAACLGGTEFLGGEIIGALLGAGYRLFAEPDLAPERLDLVVDARSRTAEDVRRTVAALRGRVGHYVLISTCEVYPSAPRLRPWRAEEFAVTAGQGMGAPAEAEAARAAERELAIVARGELPWTILRPAIVDGAGDPAGRSAWFVERILEGGLIAFPDRGRPIYRHILPKDLAAAVLAVAGRAEAFGRALNVASQGVLTWWGHAGMLRDGLGAPLRFGYVPFERWRAAGLPLPVGERAASSFIETSPLLHALGWKASDEFESVKSLAREIAARPRPDGPPHRDIERRLLADQEARPRPIVRPGALDGARRVSPRWSLRASPGLPTSLSLDRDAPAYDLPPPILRTARLVLGQAEELLLQGRIEAGTGPRAIGHNALLEVLEPGPSGLERGAHVIPLATFPCAGCAYCDRSRVRALFGVDRDGFGWGVCAFHPAHLIPVHRLATEFAILADPLAALLDALGEPLQKGREPVLIAGTAVEAALLAWLAQEAGRPAVHVARRALEHPEFPVRGMDDVVADLKAGRGTPPGIFADFTADPTVVWPLLDALPAGVRFFARLVPGGVPDRFVRCAIPLAAPNAVRLKQALARLIRWSKSRDLAARVGPAVLLEAFWDVFLAAPFRQPWLEGVQKE